MTDFLKREDYQPSGEHGCDPAERSIEELLKWGVVNLDKPKGPTSHQVVAWVKQMLGLAKAGHGGTLDPNVSGVLPTALGNATKANRALLWGSKEYVGVMRLHHDVQKKKIKNTFREFRGEIFQMPPVRAAVKRALRTRHIYESRIIEIDGRQVLFRVSCEAGTYIRTFCRDIGEALGVGAHLADLRRTRTCSFLEKDAVTLHNLKDAYVYWKEDADEAGIKKIVQPFERLFDHLPKIMIKDAAASAVSHGAPLAVAGIFSLSPGIEGGHRVAVMSAKGEGMALGRAVMSSDEMMTKKKGIAVETERVLLTGIYPKMWKKSKEKNK